MKKTTIIKFLVIFFVLGLLTACGSKTDNDDNGEEDNNNQAPMISGSPDNSIAEGDSYSFTPTATDSDGDTLTFSISSLPHWANFNNQIGSLNGTPKIDGVRLDRF